MNIVTAVRWVTVSSEQYTIPSSHNPTATARVVEPDSHIVVCV